MKYLILSHCFVRDESEKDKVNIFNFVVDYFKQKYSDLTVIVAGHGIDSIKDSIKADRILWYPFMPSEIGFGHPVCVRNSLILAKELGAKNILKMRLDSFSSHDNIFEYCENIINKENKKCLITAQTNLNHLIGDLFMYGDVDFLISIWESKDWVYNYDGMINLKNIFDKKYNSTVQDFFSYRSNDSLKWMFVTPSNLQEISTSNLNENYHKYLWDKYYGSYISEADFYKK